MVMVRGSWIHGFWFLAPGYWILASASWPPGSWHLVQRCEKQHAQTHPRQSWYNTGAWLLVRGSWILASGSCMAPGSWFLAPAWFLAPGSWLFNDVEKPSWSSRFSLHTCHTNVYLIFPCFVQIVHCSFLRHVHVICRYILYT